MLESYLNKGLNKKNKKKLRIFMDLSDLDMLNYQYKLTKFLLR